MRPASVSGMLKKLDALGLVVHESYRGARLTESGRKVALEVLRHHRLLELYLAERLGMAWDSVDAEAEVLEHVLSEELEEVIAADLGNPTLDPHGDPIPDRELAIVDVESSQPRFARAGQCGHVRPGLGLRSGDASLPDRAGDRAGSRIRADREAAVRRAAVRALRRRGARARGDPGARDARDRGGEALTPPPVEPVPAAAVEAGSLPVPFAQEASALERLLAKGRLRATLAMLGPAFVAAIAYVDPGNFATNVQGGARFGYLLLWVVLAANVMAMLIQYLSAKLGIVTDRNLPELCRERYPRPVSWGLWVQAELMAMSTDVAEFLGAALGLNLLFHVPLLVAGVMTGFIAFGILELQRHGFRRFELAITGLLGIIFLGFLYETLKIGPSASGAARGLIPDLHGTQSLYLAVGIIGATVMPHAIYLHSALTQRRMPDREATPSGAAFSGSSGSTC